MRRSKQEWLVVGLEVAVIVAAFVLGAREHARGARLAMQNACVANLKQIDGAKCSLSLELNVRSRERVEWDRVGLRDYFRGGALPVCPAGGAYNVGATVAELPTCSVHGQVLTQHVRMYRE